MFASSTRCDRAVPVSPLARSLLVMGLFSLVQGLPAWFFTLGLPALMRDNGASLSMVGLTWVVWLPQACKMLWAPLFDRPVVAPFGSRRGWLRALPLLMAGTFACVALFPPDGPLWPLLVLSLISASIGATLQIVVAAWLIGTLPAEGRAWANATGVAATVIGGMLGGGAILSIGTHLSWTFGVLLVAGLIVLLSFPVWLRADRGDDVAADQQTPASCSPWSAWRQVASRPGFGPLCAVILCFGAAGGADVLVAALMVDRGFSAEQTGWILGSVATGSVIPASALVGWALRRWGCGPVLIVLYAVKAAVLLGLGLSGPLPAVAVAALAVVDFSLSGALTVVTWQLYMNAASDGGQAATGFGVLTSLDALMRFGAGILAGTVGQSFGMPTAFAVSAAAALLAGSGALILRLSSSADQMQ